LGGSLPSLFLEYSDFNLLAMKSQSVCFRRF
jgi:hypothetical protein